MALAQQEWAESAQYYQKAVQLAPAFSFAGANRTLALYAGGHTDEAVREMRSVARQGLLRSHRIDFAQSWGAASSVSRFYLPCLASSLRLWMSFGGY